MKRMYLIRLLSTVGFVMLFTSCEKEPDPPTASFTASKSSALVGEMITFTNTSQNADTFEWDFGDGSTSTSENPSHAYSTNGNFTVTLTVTGEGGSNSVTRNVTISYPQPVAGFTMDKSSAEAGEVITFTNTSTNATSYQWDFGDGATSTEENPTHLYTAADTYTIELTATGPGGNSTATKNIEIVAPPLVGNWILEQGTYNGSPVSNLTGYFTILDDANYKANFNDGSNHGYVEAMYTISAGVFDSNMNDYSFALNGMSMVYPNGYYSSISCSLTVFNNWGATAIGVDNPTIGIQNGKLLLTSANGKAVMQYVRE